MQTELRRFYRRYHLLTFVLPAFASAALIYSVQLLQTRYTFSDARTLYFFWGTLLLIAGACAMPFFTALGFRLSGIAAKSHSPSPDEQALVKAVQSPTGKLNQEFQTRIVEIGELPMLAIGGQRPVMLWISRQVLTQTAPDDLICLIAHERAHMMARGWFDDAFAYWAFFMMVAVTLTPPFPLLFKLVLMTFSPLLLIYLRGVWTASREREADKLAAEAIGQERYVLALCRYLAQFEPGDTSRSLRFSRLRGMGLAREEANALITRAESAPAAG